MRLVNNNNDSDERTRQSDSNSNRNRIRQKTERETSRVERSEEGEGEKIDIRREDDRIEIHVVDCDRRWRTSRAKGKDPFLFYYFPFFIAVVSRRVIIIFLIELFN